MVCWGRCTSSGHKNFLGTGKSGLDLTYSNLTLEVKGRTAMLVTDYAVTGVVGGKAGNEVDATGTAQPLVTFTTTAITPGTDLTLNDADTYAASGPSSAFSQASWPESVPSHRIFFPASWRQS